MNEIKKLSYAHYICMDCSIPLVTWDLRIVENFDLELERADSSLSMLSALAISSAVLPDAPSYSMASTTFKLIGEITTFPLSASCTAC